MAKASVGVAYGLLRMKTGEKIEVAEDQIQRLSKKELQAWFFDIICTPNQIPTAKVVAEDVLTLILKYCPDLKASRICVGVTTSNEQRPAHAFMRRATAKQRDEDLFIGYGLESGRRFLWIGGEPVVEDEDDE